MKRLALIAYWAMGMALLLPTFHLGAQSTDSWIRFTSDFGNTFASAVDICPNGDYVMTSWLGRKGGRGTVLNRYSPDGTLVFEKLHYVPGEFQPVAHDVIALSNGDIAYCGKGDGIWVVRCDALGDTIWTRHITELGDYIFAYSLRETPEGGLFVEATREDPGPARRVFLNLAADGTIRGFNKDYFFYRDGPQDGSNDYPGPFRPWGTKAATWINSDSTFQFAGRVHPDSGNSLITLDFRGQVIQEIDQQGPTISAFEDRFLFSPLSPSYDSILWRRTNLTDTLYFGKAAGLPGWWKDPRENRFWRAKLTNSFREDDTLTYVYELDFKGDTISTREIRAEYLFKFRLVEIRGTDDGGFVAIYWGKQNYQRGIIVKGSASSLTDLMGYSSDIIGTGSRMTAEATDERLTVYDLSGRLVYQSVDPSDQVQLQSTLPNGTYIVRTGNESKLIQVIP